MISSDAAFPAASFFVQRSTASPFSTVQSTNAGASRNGRSGAKGQRRASPPQPPLSARRAPPGYPTPHPLSITAFLSAVRPEAAPVLKRPVETRTAGRPPLPLRQRDKSRMAAGSHTRPFSVFLWINAASAAAVLRPVPVGRPAAALPHPPLHSSAAAGRRESHSPNQSVLRKRRAAIPACLPHCRGTEPLPAPPLPLLP